MNHLAADAMRPGWCGTKNTLPKKGIAGGPKTKQRIRRSDKKYLLCDQNTVAIPVRNAISKNTE